MYYNKILGGTVGDIIGSAHVQPPAPLFHGVRRARPRDREIL